MTTPTKEHARIAVIRENPPALAVCRAEDCGASIEWVETLHGRRMPVNAPLVVLDAVDRADGRSMVWIESRTSHFVTCPEALRFRQRTAKKTASVKRNPRKTVRTSRSFGW